MGQLERQKALELTKQRIMLLPLLMINVVVGQLTARPKGLAVALPVDTIVCDTNALTLTNNGKDVMVLSWSDADWRITDGGRIAWRS